MKGTDRAVANHASTPRSSPAWHSRSYPTRSLRRLWGRFGQVVRAEWERASSPHLLLVSTSVLLYTIYWSNLTIARFNALQAHILDMGTTAEEAWLVLHAGSNLSIYWGLFATHGFAFVISPLELFPSYPVLLVFQSAALASAALAIYGIARKEIGDRLASALIAESYLLFFPVSGMNWFDFHFEIFIVPLFLWGYCFYCLDRPWPAYVLFSLTAVSTFPYGGYTALFAIINLASVTRFRSKPLLSLGNPMYWRFDLVLLSVSAVALLSGVLYLNSVGESVQTFIHIPSVALVTSGPPAIASDVRVTTLLLLFTPFLFLPLFSPRWAVFLAPALLFILLSSNNFYVDPKLFFTQYSAVIVPFIYLGVIDCMRRRVISFGWVPVAPRVSYRIANHRSFTSDRSHQAVMTGVVVLVAVLLLGTVYDPYGPYNSTNTLSYGLPASVTENATIDATLSKLISLIPASDPNLLVQNNMPEAYPRPFGNNGIILITGSTIAYNFTYFFDSHWIPASVDYVLADPWDYTYTYQAGYPYNLSMEASVQALYGSGTFGVMGEANGLILLGRNYSGPVEYYVPSSAGVPANSLQAVSPAYRDGAYISFNNVTSPSTIGFGPPSQFQPPGLPPGLYNVSYEVRTTNNSSSNQLVLDLRGGNSNLLSSTNLTGSDLSPTGGWTNVTTLVNFTNLETTLAFSFDSVTWFGELSLSAISITEVSAPSNR